MTHRLKINNNNQDIRISNTSSSRNSLRIAEINVNSIVKLQRRLDLSKLIDEHDLDITLVTETKLSPRHKLQMDGYNIIRTDRPGPNRGGGTAIVIRNDIDYNTLSHPNSANNKIIEYTLIKIKLSKNRHLIVGSLYATTKLESKQVFLDELDTLFLNLNLNNNNNNYYLIAGDFNARHRELGDRVNKTRGRWLVNWDKENSITYRSKIHTAHEPTFTSKGSESYLDLCIADSRLNLVNLINNKLKKLNYDSDHRGILIDLNLQKLEINSQSVESHTSSLYKKTKWKKFTKHINDNYSIEIPHDRNLNIAEIDEYIEQLNEAIITSIEKIVPKNTAQPKNNYYITNRLVKLHKQKSQLLTLLHKEKKSNTANHHLIKNIKIKIEAIRSKIQLEIKANIENHWEKICKKVNHRDHTKFFPIINKVFRPRERSHMPNLSIKEENSHLIDRCDIKKDDLNKTNNEYIIEEVADKINIIGAFYETINSPKYLNANTRTKEVADRTVQELEQRLARDTEENKTITVFSQENRAYAPNNNDDNYFCTVLRLEKILKRLPNKTSAGVDDITSIVLKHLPTVMIRDYSTLFNNALNRYQHSTVHAINKLLSDVTSHLAQDDIIGATLIDLEKAFDTVWLAGLIYILTKNKFSEQLVGLIWRMITGRTFYTWNGREKSPKLFKIKEGLQQGTVNSPTLFNIFTSHTLNAFKLNQDNNTYSIAYADDLILYVAAKYPEPLKVQLERLVNKLNNYYAL
ncbi:uncharacterized protein LOC123261439 [Cotesia glomerata]|uniref:uncharacterized protein LOC123261439 n=1 Tax=Cotesia glomerata TaxID=32391 RepID=UPI001D006358|nr:uncharacterized protein LOC123261439 [Cotesia glomerata]